MKIIISRAYSLETISKKDFIYIYRYFDYNAAYKCGVNVFMIPLSNTLSFLIATLPRGRGGL